MTQIWKRDWSLTIGSTRISARDGEALDVSFEVEKSLAREPNTAKIVVRNLSQDRREQLHSGSQIELSAGYVDLVSLLFSGEARRVYSGRIGPTVETTFEAQDAGRQYRTTRLDRGYPAGASLALVLGDAIDAMGIGRGNFSQFSGSLALSSTGSSSFANGYVASGPAWRVLSSVLASCGLRFSVQNGNLQVRRPGQPAERQAVVLEAGSGLVGSPVRDMGQQRGAQRREVVNVEAQLIPGLYPGRIVVLRTTVISGNYRIKRARYTGDTASSQGWLASLVLESY